MQKINTLRSFLDSKEDGIFLPGHASALIKMGSELIACDPVWGNYQPYENFIFFPKQYDCTEAISKITACTVSHIHADHWTPEILNALNCPVSIMDGRPKLFETLSKFSKTSKTYEADPGGWRGLSGWAEIYYLPNPHNTVDSSCIISNGDFTVYVGNDNFLDEKQCHEVVDAINHFDIGIEPIIDVALVPFQFVHYYPHLLESLTRQERWRESVRLEKEHIAKAKMFNDIVKPRMLVPTGGNLLYCDGHDHPLNAGLTYSDEVSFATSLLAGDYVIKKNDGLKVTRDLSGHGRPEFKKLPEMNFEVSLTALEFQSIAERVNKAGEHLDASHWIIINGIVKIMPWCKAVYYPAISINRDKHNVHEFWFDAPVFHRWASGDISFEQALGTRRFKYYREPNEYNLGVVEYYSKYL